MGDLPRAWQKSELEHQTFTCAFSGDGFNICSEHHKSLSRSPLASLASRLLQTSFGVA